MGVNYSKSHVQLLQHCGSDHFIANAARVSNDRWQESDENDERIIRYLSQCKSNESQADKYRIHFTPFTHTLITLRVKAPIFVARQLMRSTVGLSISEVSRRYVSDEPEFYEFDFFRERAESVKQGSTECPAAFDLFLSEYYEIACEHAARKYSLMLNGKCCPEQARAVLPLSTMTEWIWSGSLFAFVRVCALRLDSNAQKESREIGEMIYGIIKELFPLSVKYLLDGVGANEQEENTCTD